MYFKKPLIHPDIFDESHLKPIPKKTIFTSTQEDEMTLKQMVSKDEKHEDIEVDEQPSTHENATVIAKGVTIKGDIVSEGNVFVYGNIEGDVTANGDFRLYGSIVGNLLVENLFMEHCSVIGNIDCKGKFINSYDTTVEGDIKTDSIVIQGKIKGNIDAQSEVYLMEEAYVLGNIRTAILEIHKGSYVHGEIDVLNQKNVL